MAYCRKCGEQIDDEAVICPKCGVPQNIMIKNTVVTQEEDKPNDGLNLISFLIPLAGFIIFAVNISRFPKKANSCGKFALVGFILGIIIYWSIWWLSINY